MLGQKATRLIMVILVSVCTGEALWIWTNTPSRPVLAKIVLDMQVSDHVSVYGAIQESGGATVPFVYYYYIHRKTAEDTILHELESGSAFLRAREPATISIEAGRIKVVVAGQILNFSSRALYQDHGVKFLDVDLSATQP